MPRRRTPPSSRRRLKWANSIPTSPRQPSSRLNWRSPTCKARSNRLHSICALGLRAERIPINWTHLIGNESLNTEKLEHSLISPEIVRAILAGPDQDRTASAILDQRDPAQDERPHDSLAEFSFRDDDAAQALGEMRSASTSVFARESTSAGRPANCPTSARNSPGPSSTIGTTCPKPSRALTATVPAMSTNMPGLGSPVTSNNSPDVTAYLAETAETVNLLRPEFWEHMIA